MDFDLFVRDHEVFHIYMMNQRDPLDPGGFHLGCISALRVRYGANYILRRVETEKVPDNLVWFRMVKNRRGPNHVVTGSPIAERVKALMPGMKITHSPDGYEVLEFTRGQYHLLKKMIGNGHEKTL